MPPGEPLSRTPDAQGSHLQPPIAAQRLAPALTDEARLLLATAREAPGCNLTDARTRTGLGRHVFSTVLDALVEAGLVHRLATGRGTVLLADQPGLGDCIEQVKALLDPLARRLHAFLHDEEIHPRQEVVEHATTWGWSEATTRWRLRVLEKAELVQAVVDVRDPRCLTYRYLPLHPLVHEILDHIDPASTSAIG